MALLSVDLSPFKKRRYHAAIEGHSIGFESPLSRVATYGEGSGARWRVTIEFAPMQTTDAERLRALIEHLNGPSNSFLLDFTDAIEGAITPSGNMTYSDNTTYSDGQYFGDFLTAGYVIAQTELAAAAQSTTLSLNSLDSGQVIPAGTRIGIRIPSDPNYQVVRAVQSATATSAGVATVTIRPRLRFALGAGQQVRVGNPPFKLRLIDDLQSNFETGPKWAPGPTIEFVEAF